MTPDLIITISTAIIALMAFANDFAEYTKLNIFKNLLLKFGVIACASIVIYCATMAKENNAKAELLKKDSQSKIDINNAVGSVIKTIWAVEKENEDLSLKSSIASKKEQKRRDIESIKLNLISLKNSMKQSQTINDQLTQANSDSSDIRINYVKEIRQIFNNAISNAILLKNDTLLIKYNYLISNSENLLQELTEKQFAIVNGASRFGYTGDVNKIRTDLFNEYNGSIKSTTSQTLRYCTNELGKINANNDNYSLKPPF